MPRCLISFGANIGNPLETIRTAADLLRQQLVSTPDDFQLSRYFRTPPVGGPSGQPPFINAVAAVTTPHAVETVWQAVRAAERELGRQRDRRWEARRIDLDILLYDDLRIWTPQLKIPHPRMCMRRFILIPAAEVAAQWLDPVSGWTIGRLAEAVRSGPANLILVSDDVPHHASWLPDIARLTMSEIIPLGIAPALPWARWICLTSLQHWRQAVATLPPDSYRLRTKLVMFLTSPGPPAAAAEPAGSWEERHADLASWLRLVAPESPAGVDAQSAMGKTCCDGPRYLLSSDDRQWAVHEIVSAMEAMDCPIEPL